ncbi:hypothetical protein DYB32_002967, partial [Aphanomyces invadans]
IGGDRRSTTPATLTKAQKKKNRKMAKKKADGHVVSTAVSLSSGAQTVALPTYPIVRLDHHADHIPLGDPSKSTLKRVELYPNDPAGSDSDVDMGAEAEVEGGGCTEPAQDAAAGHSGHTPQRYARPERCMVCHRPSTNRCGHCKHCMYCSKACQLAHWKYHKPHCARIKGTVAVSAVDIHGRQGQAGLRNLGNTCFMNAALQCLSHTTALTFHFLTNSYQTDLNTDNVLGTGGKLATQYALLLKVRPPDRRVWSRSIRLMRRLLQELWLGTASSVSPGPLKRAIGTFAPQFSGYQQHDAQELLAYLLDGLHEDVNRITKKPYVQVQDSNGTEPDAVVAATAWRHHKLRNESIVVDTLHGQFKSTVVCPHCDKVSITFDPFNCVQLELPHAVTRLDTIQARATHGLTLADCFQKFTSAEQLDEDNLWYCSNCKQHRQVRCWMARVALDVTCGSIAHQATKTMQLYALPDILILSLKRFEYRNDVVRDKLDVLVDFPVEGLDMAPYCLSAAPDHTSSLIYDLYATTNHFGSMGFGHYTAFAKDHATNLWYNFDDSAVTSVSAASVVSNAAYILFYKRRAPSPTPRL